MSMLLYRLGRAAARHHWRVLSAWLAVLAITLGAAVALGGSLQSSFEIPGAESQRGIDTLQQRLPQASGTSAQIVVVAHAGTVTQSGHRRDIERMVSRLEDTDHVTTVSDPFAAPATGSTNTSISKDRKYALVHVQIDGEAGNLPHDLTDRLEHRARMPAGSGLTSHVGGDAFQPTTIGGGISEVLGVVVAFVVLAITFGSLLAAGLPLLGALIGVATTMGGILVVASQTDIASVTSTLAMMLGLAVGIDYALFITFRHRSQLVRGLEVTESVAQATATAGSAVVFAGVTVVIALIGLSVAGIPFLTVMGVAAAAGVGVAVLMAVTLLPAILGLLGERLRPKPDSRVARRELGTETGPTWNGKPRRRPRRTLGSRWVALVTKVPVVTIVVILAGLAVVAVPAKDLQLGLPDRGSDPVGSTSRTTYDLISKGFGPGYNATLEVTADIIESTDPVGAVNELADKIRAMPGVAAVPVATPNAQADLGFLQIVPEGTQTSQTTIDLVHRIRAERAGLERDAGVSDLLVTGTSAVAIDISQKLSDALLPFGAVVVGLCLLLLMVVFRSIAVPIKATLGYLVSVLASFGITAAVFTWGWGTRLLNVEAGPVISFLPIIVMGVLFGLAMDYEVFLVSRIREEYVLTGDPRAAVHRGFTASARVVTAAATIMFFVFISFVPEGTAMVKPLALSLAMGVFVDAFIVRMSLVPAVLALLGHAAWWLPRWLDRMLPDIDVEGAGLRHQLEVAAWNAGLPSVAVRADGLRFGPGPALDLEVPAGTVLAVAADRGAVDLRARLLATLAGRIAPEDGRLVVLGHVLPDEAGQLLRHVALVDAPGPDEHRSVRALVAGQTALTGTRPERRRAGRRATLDAALTELGTLPGTDDAVTPTTPVAALGELQRALLGVRLALVGRPGLVVVDDVDRLSHSADRTALWAALDRVAAGGITVVAGHGSDTAAPSGPHIRTAQVVLHSPALEAAP